MPSTTPPIDVATPPDWDSIPDEILCPLCEYNLRGIPEPRCPECGFKFEWDEVLRYDPEVIVLMPCDFDVERSARDAQLLAGRPGWETLAAVRSGQVWAVHGGAYFNRPGPRVVDGVEILAEILHPEVFPRRENPEDYRSLVPPILHRA